MPEPAIIMLRLACSMIDQPENSRTDDQLSAILDNAAERKSPMDFTAWFEVYLGDRWYTLDARHTKPRIGRISGARREATDVAIVTSFGACTLAGFKVITEEVTSAAPASAVFPGLTVRREAAIREQSRVTPHLYQSPRSGPE
jgi:transglutaminase-like putative cysteine protease